ncbi:unnamed protein product [Heligmosomoides polygyrus]|uniref:SH2 domain-containing protein n=1 Tax=Heligmosomoides polygyrus TaxID=6339 RepID=A0A3P8CXH9_HELPZ|nr:unnamed protein product [Heligmosomoides polygyrus]
MQHIGRPTATHLLRQMEPGNFIVRASSKPGCMAISVRLPDGHDTLTDHYVVHQFFYGFRTQSSPYSFRSLPLLIEHYCMHPWVFLSEHTRMLCCLLVYISLSNQSERFRSMLDFKNEKMKIKKWKKFEIEPNIFQIKVMFFTLN